MVNANCPRCSHEQFDVSRMTLASRLMVNYDFVHCAKCGAVVHVIELTVLEQLNEIAAGLAHRKR